MRISYLPILPLARSTPYPLPVFPRLWTCHYPSTLPSTSLLILSGCSPTAKKLWSFALYSVNVWRLHGELFLLQFFFRCLLSLRPTSNGERIEPNGLRAWLRRRGLYWSCFCPLETGEPMSCQIVHGTYGRVSAYCGQFPSHCGFRCKFAFFSYTSYFIHSFVVDLSRLHHDAIYESEYQHLPIRKSHGHEFCWHF